MKIQPFHTDEFEMFFTLIELNDTCSSDDFNFIWKYLFLFDTTLPFNLYHDHDDERMKTKTKYDIRKRFISLWVSALTFLPHDDFKWAIGKVSIRKSRNNSRRQNEKRLSTEEDNYRLIRSEGWTYDEKTESESKVSIFFVPLSSTFDSSVKCWNVIIIYGHLYPTKPPLSLNQYRNCGRLAFHTKPGHILRKEQTKKENSPAQSRQKNLINPEFCRFSGFYSCSTNKMRMVGMLCKWTYSKRNENKTKLNYATMQEARKIIHELNNVRMNWESEILLMFSLNFSLFHPIVHSLTLFNRFLVLSKNICALNSSDIILRLWYSSRPTVKPISQHDNHYRLSSVHALLKRGLNSVTKNKSRVRNVSIQLPLRIAAGAEKTKRRHQKFFKFFYMWHFTFWADVKSSITT